MPLPAWSNAFGKMTGAGSEVDPTQPAPTLISIPSLDSYSEEEIKEAADSLGRRHATIWEMAESGLSPDDISTTTGQPIGEVELILNLKRQVRSLRPAE